MYSLYLETFLHVADVGSFNKAANDLYISSSAANKQISALEASLNTKLFVRGHNGLVLTAAGKSLYTDSKNIIQVCRASAERARNAELGDDNTIRVGVAYTTYGETFLKVFAAIYAEITDTLIELVPVLYDLQDEGDKAPIELHRNIDVIVDFFENSRLKSKPHQIFGMCSVSLCCGVPIHHRLASREFLRIQDLYEERLMMLRRGIDCHTDAIRDDIEQHHPQIGINEFSLLTSEVFNQCARSNCLFLSVPDWTSIHPAMKMIPVEWDYKTSLSLIYAENPTPTVLKFVDAIKRISYKFLGNL